jgi:hypothetical protein
VTAEAPDYGAAIEWASQMRAAREYVCDGLSSGTITLGEVMAERSDPRAGQIHLLTVLESLPAARKIDTRRGLAAAGLAMRVPLCDLSEDQVSLVLDRFQTAAGPVQRA